MTFGSRSAAEVVVHPDKNSLAAAVAARLVVRVLDAQVRRGRASVVLTGGTVGIQLLREVASSPASHAVDWSRVDLWWGDERFVTSDDGDRNAVQAREALLDTLATQGLREDAVHVMPATDDADVDNPADPDAAAARYAAELAEAARAEGVGGSVPVFDVLMLGVGPDGHVASLFPEHPSLKEGQEAGREVIAVRDSPKPPPTRLSLTLPVITSAEEVWLVVGGADKADAVAEALAGPGRLPASLVSGTRRTLWLLDRDAASQL
ncbi:6-phosphogluconolactonase [Quadrisphaera granulorum]|uniref:6-phosphogluconolactonase n=1 Tax=Quadrisphaera granulorum TaxID=317664 RepID=A0A315ZYT4_9ACTN|nr:6-phosphogluconolactonase [Quadrisphaera granulorum]PWJ50655.1 6-phosphogluconolactonase [Quadrisphaera granulorum]SZE97903.1 6-phosphogluconolactonase [Quadrisphaera granulorum]